MKRKIILIGIIAAMLVSALAGCTSGTKDDAEQTGETTDSKEGNAGVTLRVGVQSTDYVQYLETEYGFFEEAFKEEGVTVELTNFESGPAITEALASDSLDIGFLGDLPTLTSASAGNQISIIGKGAGTTNGIALILPEGSDIKELSELKGKRIAYTVGTAGHAFLVKALETAGLTENDIEGINVPGPDIEATLIGGDVDAVVTVGVFINKIEIAGEGIVLLDNTEVYTPVTAIIASNTFLSEHSDLAVQFLDAWHDICTYANENKDEVEEALARQQDTDISFFQRFNVEFDDEWTDDDTETLKVTEKFLVDNDLVAEEIDPESILNLEFLDEVLQ